MLTLAREESSRTKVIMRAVETLYSEKEEEKRRESGVHGKEKEQSRWKNGKNSLDVR